MAGSTEPSEGRRGSPREATRAKGTGPAPPWGAALRTAALRTAAGFTNP